MRIPGKVSDLPLTWSEKCLIAVMQCAMLYSVSMRSYGFISKIAWSQARRSG